MRKQQKSILSFFQKPSQPIASGGGSVPKDPDPASAASAAEVRGTDTPPEKCPRPVFPGRPSGAAGRASTLPVSSILSKFVREENRIEREHNSNDSTVACAQFGKTSATPLVKQVTPSRQASGPPYSGFKSNYTSLNVEPLGFNLHLDILEGDDPSEVCFMRESKADERKLLPDLQTPGNDCRKPSQERLGNSCKEQTSQLIDFGCDLDILGPETPLMQPLVPGLKRVKEDSHDVSERHAFLLAESNKRMKLLRESGHGEKVDDSQCDTSQFSKSKFEWLNPPFIRDAQRKRPSDPLYDKRTLYIPPDALSKMSATQRQYWDVKRQYMDVVLFFKLGKFYELYELDAEIGQKELDWKMTLSGVARCRQVGISESGIDDAIQKLTARGYKVGRVEQMETSDQAKSRGSNSVIQRKLTHICTPSTATDYCVGPDSVHLLALKEVNRGSEKGRTVYGFSFVDYAALKVWVGSICDYASCSGLGALLVQVSPKEVVYERNGLSRETFEAIKKYAPRGADSMQLTPTPGIDFPDALEVQNLVNSKGYFSDASSFWDSEDCIDHFDVAICALGGLLSYLSRMKLVDALCNGDLLPYHVYRSCLKMDGHTLVNLEIFSNNIDGGTPGTLFNHVDHCTTSLGKRLLKKWICHPLTNIEEINDRLNVVEGLIQHPGVSSVIAEHMQRLPDLERLLGRVKSFSRLSATILLPFVGERILRHQVKSFGSLLKGLHIGLDLLQLLQKEDKSLPFSRIFSFPVLPDLDKFLKQIEIAMQEDFLDNHDHKIQDADSVTLSQLVELFIGRVSEWSQVIHALSCVDVLYSFAVTTTSSTGSMSRPVIVPSDSHSVNSYQGNDGPILKMEGLWHPYAVRESGGTIVPNDIYLGENATGWHPRTLLLTGPNMGGKSTLLRATCLAVILAQLGCFVPCDSCLLSRVDVIFTRLGAVDRIMSGESTFYIECAETASILKNASQDSLVLLDELGRGTSTFDGYAIAYAVLRHLVEKVHCRLLFATHYHPLTKEFASHPHVSLGHMGCAFIPRKSSSGSGEKDLIFLYRLAPGACPESYGLQVALMAGVPPRTVEAASKASARMKVQIVESFRSSEGRSAFSTLHEECLKTVLAISKIDSADMDDDSYDTLLCLWHELKHLQRTT